MAGQLLARSACWGCISFGPAAGATNWSGVTDPAAAFGAGGFGQKSNSTAGSIFQDLCIVLGLADTAALAAAQWHVLC